MKTSLDWQSLVGKTIAAVEPIHYSNWCDENIADAVKVTFADGTHVWINSEHHWSSAGISLGSEESR